MLGSMCHVLMCGPGAGRPFILNPFPVPLTPALVWSCDTPRRLRDARHVLGGTGDGGEASSRARACMALTLIAWEGLGPTFRSAANAGDAALCSAAPAGSAGTQGSRRTRGKRLIHREPIVMLMGVAGPLGASRVPGRDV